MRRLKLVAFTLTLFAFNYNASAQLSKIEQAIEDGNYQRVDKLCLDAKEDKDMKKLPEVYYYHAQALIAMSKDELIYKKNPDLVKEGVKSLLKGMKRDEDNVKDDFSEVFDIVADRQIEIADASYNINKASKAVKLYGYSYDINQNRYSYMMQGKCLIQMEDSSEGEKYYKELIKWFNQDHDKDEDAQKFSDPYLYFIDKYYIKGMYDSANYFINNGRIILGGDPKFDFFHKEITLEQIKKIPPSSMMLDMVQDAITYNPTDKELLHKENAVYIYLIKNAVLANNFPQTDTLLTHFIAEKVARASSKDANAIKKIDDFVEQKPENVLWKLAEYFQIYEHTESCKYTLDRYMAMTAPSLSDEDIAKRWSALTGYAYDTKSLPFAAFILKRAIEKYPNDETFKNLRTKIVVDKENTRTTVDEQAVVYGFMHDMYFNKATDKETKDRLIQANEKYIGLLTASNQFEKANLIFEELIFLKPDGDHTFRREQMAKDDFYQNYFLTKTKGKDEKGREIEAFAWGGDPNECSAGIIPDEIHNKVLNRINYFRRNAGVPTVLFDQATNEYCQKAALMMTVNNKLDHDPTSSWSCYSDEGKYAAKHSLLVKDANTSLAVTYIMADKNPSAGNRRWLLYPNGQVYGHGSTNDVAVIWALDDSGSTDTIQYMEKGICWPPEGYVPQMMLFENWTFGIYQDVNNATVEVKQDGEIIPVKVEPYVKGYGAPTVVFKPSINKSALPEKSKFDVTITLSNGRKYYYSVNTFSYDPNR